MGTVAGMATWLSLVLKDAFALVGMSAYLNIVFDIPAKPLALALIAAFSIVNILGSRASGALQMVLVAFVLAALGWFLGAGLTQLDGSGDMSPFLTDGVGGLMAVIGLVFVSYGGLTKVASAAEEIEDPSRNIPLGMSLSLLVSTTVYTLGMLVTVAVLPAVELHDDLAPDPLGSKSRDADRWCGNRGNRRAGCLLLGHQRRYLGSRPLSPGDEPGSPDIRAVRSYQPLQDTHLGGSANGCRHGHGGSGL